MLASDTMTGTVLHSCLSVIPVQLEEALVPEIRGISLRWGPLQLRMCCAGFLPRWRLMSCGGQHQAWPKYLDPHGIVLNITPGVGDVWRNGFSCRAHIFMDDGPPECQISIWTMPDQHGT
jgi:hypothetical protein